MFSSLLTILLCNSAFAIPVQMNHQGRLLDDEGKGLTGAHDLVFTIYEEQTDGNVQWSEVQTVQFNNGYYSVILGTDENNPLDDSILANYPLFMQLTVDQEVLEPRHQMGSVPYAQIAGVAERVDGGVVNASEVNVGGQAVINADGQWVGEAPIVDFMNLQNRPQGLDDGDDNTQLSQSEVVDYVNGSQVNLGAASQVDGSDIVTVGSFNGYLPTDLADGDNDLLASISCTVGELISWDGNASWVCVSDNTLELADIETMLTNNPMDLNAATTIGGLDIVTSIDDSDTLASLSCQNDGEIARYDLVLDEWYCSTDIDTDTVLDQAGVLSHVNGEALSLATGTQVNGSDVVTVNTFVSNLPSDLADGDADTQLDQAGVLGFVDGQTINLGTNSQVNNRNIVGQPSTCSNGQVLVYNSTSNDWDCGDDTDTTLTPSEMQTVIEALTLNLQNIPQVNNQDILTVGSSIAPNQLDTSTASSGQVLTYDGNQAQWATPNTGCQGTTITMGTREYTLIDCGSGAAMLATDYGTQTPVSSLAPSNFNANHAFCALHNDGKAHCWGNDMYDLITNTPTDKYYQEITLGQFHACAREQVGRAVQCWGYDGRGAVSGVPSGPFIQLTSGSHFTCGIYANYTNLCWGDDSSGIVSNAPATQFTEITSGSNHACGITATGNIECWGGSNGSVVTQTPSGTFTSLVSGGNHNCALDTNGYATCWGSDSSGQVSNTPTNTIFTSIHAGPDHNCGITANGDVLCWGSDSRGESSNVPTDTFTDIQLSYNFSCGITTSGAIKCWGKSNVVNETPIGGVFTELAVNYSNACAKLEKGNVVCWYGNYLGQNMP